MAPKASERWQLVAEVEQSQAQVVSLLHDLRYSASVGESITRSVEKGSDELARIMARADAFQATSEQTVRCITTRTCSSIF